jgi:hypothetical protein
VVSSPNVGTTIDYLAAVAHAPGTDQLWAGGSYSNSSNGPFQVLIEQWNGSSWSVVPSPNPGGMSNLLQGVAAVSANDVWAVGIYYSSSTSPGRH